MRYLTIASSMLLLGASLAQAQTPTNPPVPPPFSAVPSVSEPPEVIKPGASTAAIDAADRRFAELAAKSGMAEVQAAQLAESKTKDPSVKDFAVRMVADHTKANQQLMQIAGAKGLTISTSPDTADAVAFQMLRSASGSSFNRIYVRNQVQDHLKAVSLFKTEA